MKKTILFAAVFLFSTQAKAADPWSDGDKAREAMYSLLHIADWGQTLYTSEYPELYREANPFLGDHPSRRQVNTYFLTSALLHVGAVHFMPSRWRPAFQYFWIGFESIVVTGNYSVGVKIGF